MFRPIVQQRFCCGGVSRNRLSSVGIGYHPSASNRGSSDGSQLIVVSLRKRREVCGLESAPRRLWNERGGGVGDLMDLEEPLVTPKRGFSIARVAVPAAIAWWLAERFHQSWHPVEIRLAPARELQYE
eukprot:scaffold1454_cov112-Isochrysis_galbana.AAC.2